MVSVLHQIEFAKAVFRLDFHDPYLLTVEKLLRLRRNLNQAVKQVELLAGASKSSSATLFSPPLSSDPYARRRYQLPGPSFVIHPPKERRFPIAVEGCLELPVLLFGAGIQSLRELARVFQALGARGFHRGEGQFELAAIDAEDLAGNRIRVWHPGATSFMPLPVMPAGWWLDTFAQPSEVKLQLHTPARLMTDGRPLFKPNFSSLFPFIFRRVTAMVHAHCGLDLIDDAGSILSSVRCVQERDNRLFWQDWRCLAGGDVPQDLGGIVGSLSLSGEGLLDILWLLRLATLLNLGKGASYGAGHLTLEDMS